MADNKEHSGGALPASYEEIVREYGKRVMAVAYDYVKDYDAAQDVAQEVFIRVWQKGDRFQAQASVFSWIYRITVNMAIDHLRKAKSRGKLSDSEGTYREVYETEQYSGSTRMSPGLSIDQQALRDRLDESLEVLSENQKRAFVLRYYQDMSIEEIAGIMGCKESTVRQHLFRASHKLRDELADLADRFLPPKDEEERDDTPS